MNGLVLEVSRVYPTKRDRTNSLNEDIKLGK